WAWAGASVVALGADEQLGAEIPEAERGEVLRRLELDRPFVLATGTIEPRKNLSRLIDAFAGLPGELKRTHLLALAGPRGWADEQIFARAGEDRDCVRILGRVTDMELVALYGSRAAFCS